MNILNNIDNAHFHSDGEDIDIIRIYLGSYLVWELVKDVEDIIDSCYGAGYWVNELPYLNDDAWKN